MRQKERRNNKFDSGSQQIPPGVNDAGHVSNESGNRPVHAPEHADETKSRPLDNNRRQGNKVSIHISAIDSFALRKQALETGVPYHSLVSSIIHEYVTGKN